MRRIMCQVVKERQKLKNLTLAGDDEVEALTKLFTQAKLLQ